MAVIFVSQERFAEVYRQLEALAARPKDIATTTEGPTLGLVVPDDLYRRWVQSQESKEQANNVFAPTVPKKRTTKKEST